MKNSQSVFARLGSYIFKPKMAVLKIKGKIDSKMYNFSIQYIRGIFKGI